MIIFNRKINLCIWACRAVIVGICLSGCASHNEEPNITPSWQPAPGALASPQGLPQIGKWMLDAQYEPAHWLGELHQGRNLQEPINIIIIDTVSQSPQEAKKNLVQNFAQAGYSIRKGHSTGYRGYIGGVIYEQFPDGEEEAFSNEPSEMHNNHGRIFGPHAYRGGWLFIGAFSREKLEILDKIKHRYISFNQARDDLAQRLDINTNYKIKGFIELDNTFIDNSTFTSGDHDGIGVLMVVSNP